MHCAKCCSAAIAARIPPVPRSWSACTSPRTTTHGRNSTRPPIWAITHRMTSGLIPMASRCVTSPRRTRATTRPRRRPPARACASRKVSSRIGLRRRASSVCGTRPRRRRTNSPLTPPIRPRAPTSPTATRSMSSPCASRPASVGSSVARSARRTERAPSPSACCRISRTPTS